MSVPLTINGVTYQYPQQFDLNWGPTLTNWSTAVTNGMLQKAGGSFTLTSEVDFGSSFGLKSLYLKSRETNPGSTGVLRLGNASTGVVWRNAANSGDLTLTVNASNQLTFNGSPIAASSSLTDSHIYVGNVSNQPTDVAMSGDIAITNAGVTSIASGVIVNADVNASAAIALSKLANSITPYSTYASNASGVLDPYTLTASRAVVSNANGLPVSSTTTATEVGYLSGVGSAIQTQINGLLPLTGGTMSGVINMGNSRIAAVATPTTTGDAIGYGQAAIRGSTSNAGSAQDITQGTISTPDLRANAVTQVQTANSSLAFSQAFGTQITSVSITTSGGPVMLLADASVNVTGSGGFIRLLLFRDSGTALIHVQNAPAGTDANSAQSLVFVDAPVAGTYTYKLWYFLGGVTINSVNAYHLSAVELKK